MQAPFRGTVRVDGNPIRGADVLLLDAAGKVVAVAQTDEAGGYRLASPAGFSRGMLLARLYRPIVGARATAVTHPAETGFDFATRDTVALAGDVEAPAGVTLDFLDVSLTPRALDGVPASAAMALIAVDTGPALKASYLTEQIQQPRFAFRVVPGTWELLVNRVVEEAPTVKPSTPNLTNAELTLPDGSKPAQAFGAYRLEVRHDLHVRVRLEAIEHDGQQDLLLRGAGGGVERRAALRRRRRSSRRRAAAVRPAVREAPGAARARAPAVGDRGAEPGRR